MEPTLLPSEHDVTVPPVVIGMDGEQTAIKKKQEKEEIRKKVLDQWGHEAQSYRHFLMMFLDIDHWQY